MSRSEKSLPDFRPSSIRGLNLNLSLNRRFRRIRLPSQLTPGSLMGLNRRVSGSRPGTCVVVTIKPLLKRKRSLTSLEQERVRLLSPGCL